MLWRTVAACYCVSFSFVGVFVFVLGGKKITFYLLKKKSDFKIERKVGSRDFIFVLTFDPEVNYIIFF